MLSQSYIDVQTVLDNPYEQGFADRERGKTLFDCPYSSKDKAGNDHRSKWLQGMMTYEANHGLSSVIA
jgi:hypothetical protein